MNLGIFLQVIAIGFTLVTGILFIGTSFYWPKEKLAVEHYKFLLIFAFSLLAINMAMAGLNNLTMNWVSAGLAFWSATCAISSLKINNTIFQWQVTGIAVILMGLSFSPLLF